MAVDRHAEMGLSAGVFRRENIWSAPSSFGNDSSYQDSSRRTHGFGYNLGLWSDGMKEPSLNQTVI